MNEKSDRSAIATKASYQKSSLILEESTERSVSLVAEKTKPYNWR